LRPFGTDFSGRLTFDLASDDVEDEDEDEEEEEEDEELELKGVSGKIWERTLNRC
jgi:hypothetical protein